MFKKISIIALFIQAICLPAFSQIKTNEKVLLNTAEAYKKAEIEKDVSILN